MAVTLPAASRRALTATRRPGKRVNFRFPELAAGEPGVGAGQVQAAEAAGKGAGGGFQVQVPGEFQPLLGEAV
ncbi:hypothetical protein GMST_32710 [Geomonas silvestris]|uniref:Uncharacterized protein n=1 Tax=Geomonas silvestris TaxID=2740184 RepID=A0A6V8MLR8_9BACT|nr:hypothetical protein GMST_32710 [Geomonas silvestris]